MQFEKKTDEIIYDSVKCAVTCEVCMEFTTSISNL